MGRGTGRRRGIAGLHAGMVLLLAASVCAGQSGAPSDHTDQTDQAQQPMTKAQAKQLFRSVDEILGFVSADSQLPVRHTVKRKLLSRDQVNRFLRSKFDEDEGAKRLQQDEIVLKKFGLLDRDFHLRPFLISLLTEQIAGFYDNKTRTVNLLDWIAPEQQKPVLAHELTHALQDQAVDLTRWSDVSPTGTPDNVQEDNRHLQLDEADTARGAVAEGQAMVTFIDYSLRGTGKTVANAPDVVGKLSDSASDSSGSPVLGRAPLLLQESLLFPYSEGLRFEQSLLVRKGKQGAFEGALDHPPSSSFEIMNPEAYIAHTPVPMLLLPDLHPLLNAEYVPYDLGVMGELDVRIMTELFGGREMGQALAPAWAGGIYYAAQRKSASPAEKETPASLALLYYSRWKNRDSARSFLRVYADEIGRKYTKAVRRPKDEANDGEEVYSTEEGDVLLSIDGRSVFVSEGFSLPLARKLRDEIADAQGHGPVKTARETAPELGLGISHDLAGFGMVKAALDGREGLATIRQPDDILGLDTRSGAATNASLP